MPVIPKPNSCKQSAGFYNIEAESFVLQKEKDAAVTAAEGYRLCINEQGVTAYAAGERGFFYAEKTLEQLREVFGNRLPHYDITDEPVYAYRGFMIDCCRHFFSVADIKQMIEAASRFKFNKFHWHLTEDQGWRIAIDRYPKLVEVGSVRPYSKFGRTYEPGEYGGSYSKDEIREIVAFCAERFIDVVPELELPGHASSILAAYPELSCSGKQVQVKTGGGIFPDVLCAGKETVYTFLENVLEEYIELFPYELYHIGGDEAPKAHWRGCEDCQNKIKTEGLANESELQGYMTNRVAAYLREHGKTAIVWNDALKGGNIDPQCIVQYWLGDTKSSVEHASKGGKVIVSEFFHYYLDYSYGQTPLKKVYAHNPDVVPLTSDESNPVVGVEAPLWAEYIPDLSKLSYMAWPRLAAVAENGWTKQENKEYSGFERRLEKQLNLLKKLDMNCAPPADWNPKGIKKAVVMTKFWANTVTWNAARLVRQQVQERKAEKKG